MRPATPTVPGGGEGEPALVLTLVLPLADAAHFAAYAARRGLTVERVIELLVEFARFGEDGTLSLAPLTPGSDEADPHTPEWAREALVDEVVMSRRNAYPVMVLPGRRTVDQARALAAGADDVDQA